MKHYISFDGRLFIVSAEFATAVRNTLGTLSFNSVAVDQERLTLLAVSNRRPLTPVQVRRVEYLQHILNVLNTIIVVGSHHDPVKEWGFDGWDAVHGNAHHQPCGCIKHYVFDHHSATNHFGHNRVSAERKHHEIEPIYTCPAHLFVHE